MPTSLDVYRPFDAGAGANVTESGWRDMARLWLPTGPILREDNGLAVFGDSTGLHAKVRTGKCWIRGHYGENTAEKTIAIDDPSGIPGGESRIDRIILRADFTNNRIELDKLTGTPAASPAVPALTQSSSMWEIALAKITGITNATTTVSAGMVTREDTQVAPPGLRVAARIRRAANQSIPSTTTTTISWDTEDEDTDGFIAVPGTTITIPAGLGGLYIYRAHALFATSPGGGVRSVLFSPTGRRSAPENTSGDHVSLWICDQTPLVPGDTLTFTVFQGSGGALNLTAGLDLYRVEL